MPTRSIVNKEMVQKQRTAFNRILKDLHEHACEGMLISFINTLLETVIMTMSYKHSPGKIATYKDVSRNLPKCENLYSFVFMRDQLIHELYGIDNIVTFVQHQVTEFGKDNWDFLSDECFDNAIDLWSELNSIIGNCSVSRPSRIRI